MLGSSVHATSEGGKPPLASIIRNPRNSTPAKALMPKTYIGSLHPELDV